MIFVMSMTALVESPYNLLCDPKPVVPNRWYAYPRGYAKPSQGVREGPKINLVYIFKTCF